MFSIQPDIKKLQKIEHKVAFFSFEYGNFLKNFYNHFLKCLNLVKFST